MKKNMLVVVLVTIFSMVVLSACDTKAELKKLTGLSWAKAVEYVKGGSGPSDPSNNDWHITAVSHSNQLIVDNAKLDPRACFDKIDDATWQKIQDWADQWGSDSPTRIEWQVDESRCSWVFPGDVTDAISQKDYEDLLKIFSDAGYNDTWFVSGPEGGEFGRKTYAEIKSASPYISRVHVYGFKLTEMPTRQ